MANFLLSRLEHSGRISPESCRELERLIGTVRDVPARKYIVREGDPAPGIPVMLSGWAARYKLLPAGARQITGFMVPGDCADRTIEFRPAPDHSIIALTPCKIAFINGALLRQALADHPDLGRAFSWCSLVDEAVLQSWVVNIGAREGFERTAHLMCEMHVRMGLIGLIEETEVGGPSFQFPLTQDELADAVGLTPVHTNRVLQRMRREGLIQFAKRWLEIHDIRQLRAIADFDPGYLHLDSSPARHTFFDVGDAILC